MRDALQLVILVGEGGLEMSREWVVLRTAEGREIEFRCFQGRARVEFGDGSPFADTEFVVARGGGALTGPPLAGRERRDPYRYAVEVRARGQLLRREFELYVDP